MRYGVPSRGRRAAALALGKLTTERKHREALEDLLEDDDPHLRADVVRALIHQGADPNWVAPNGIPVLEHALLRYWNGAAVDVMHPRAAGSLTSLPSRR